MAAPDAFEKARAALIEGLDLDAKLLVAAGIQELARPHGIQPVVTGGTTVDFYAAEALEEESPFRLGWKPSRDIDIVFLGGESVTEARRLRRLLAENGFVPSADSLPPEQERGWRHPRVPVAVEVIAHSFHGDPDRIITVEVRGHEAVLRGPEDTLYEHVEWGAHAHDQASWTRALAIVAAQADRLDLDYLRDLAKERGHEDALERCLAGEPIL